jgi:hypothetical protein
MGQDEIDALLAQQSKPAAPAPSGPMGQDEIDALLAQQSKPAAPAPSGPMGQDEIDALLAQQSKPAAPAPAGEGGQLDQAAIDALFGQQQAKPAPPPAPEISGGGQLDQSAIDALLAQQQAKPAPQPAPEISGGGQLDQSAIDALLAQQAQATKPTAPVSESSELDQSAIDQLMAQQAVEQTSPDDSPRPVDKPRQEALSSWIEQIPNQLGARTLAPTDLQNNKRIKGQRNSKVTGVRRSVFYLPDTILAQEAAMQALQKLFGMADQFRSEGSENRYANVASVSNRWGLETEISLTRIPQKPVRIKMKNVPAFNKMEKFMSADQVYLVDRFVPNSGGNSKRWVDWFVMNYETQALEDLAEM